MRCRSPTCPLGQKPKMSPIFVQVYFFFMYFVTWLSICGKRYQNVKRAKQHILRRQEVDVRDFLSIVNAHSDVNMVKEVKKNKIYKRLVLMVVFCHHIRLVICTKLKADHNNNKGQANFKSVFCQQEIYGASG